MKSKELKRIVSLLILSILAVFMTACGSTEDEGASDSTETKPKITILIRDRGDLSYWDSMAEGGDRAAVDFADIADIKVLETSADITANLDHMYAEVDAGADLIITNGEFGDNIIQVGEEYPDVGFAVIGEDMSEDGVYSIDFQTAEASFLSGIAAADISSSGLEGTSQEKKIGFIGGMDETLVIQEFLLGYLQGATYYDENIETVINYVGDWNDPETSRNQALTQYNDANADIILAAAGSSGNGVHNAAASTGKYIIGVDSDQREMYKEDEEISTRFVTSVIKEIGNTVYNVIDEFLTEGTLKYGTYDTVGLADDSVSIIMDAQFEEYISEDGKKAIEEAREGIISGEIKVEGALGKSQTEVYEIINEHTNR